MTDLGLVSLILASLIVATGALQHLKSRPKSPPFQKLTDWQFPEGRSSKVLILSAGMGGGHNAAAHAIESELIARGHQVILTDGLKQMSPAMEFVMRRSYILQLRYAPWSYDLIFKLASFGPVSDFIRYLQGVLYGGHLLRQIAQEDPDLIVSTYPLVTAALGYLRRTGRLSVPVAAVVSDYGIHPMWVARGVDRSLVVSRQSYDVAAGTGSAVSIVRPLVGPEYHHCCGRLAARRQLGLPEDAFISLVVGGAWGVGNLAEVAEQVLATGARVIVVAGRNEELHQELENHFGEDRRVTIFGWTNEMPRLLAAADCLIQNAGGITCLEAIAVGTPIIFFDTIAGHGRLNAQMMESAGAATWARCERDFIQLLSNAVSGAVPLKPALPEPAVDAAEAVLSTRPIAPLPAYARRRTLPHPRAAFSLIASLSIVAMLSFSPGGIALASRGFDIDMPGSAYPTGKAGLAVEVSSPAVATAVERAVIGQRLPVTIFVDTNAVSGLFPAAGVSFGIANEPSRIAWVDPIKVHRSSLSTADAIEDRTGIRPAYFLPLPREINLATMLALRHNTRMVIPHRWDVGQDGINAGINVLHTDGMTPDQAVRSLSLALTTMQQEGLQCVPLFQLSS